MNAFDVVVVGGGAAGLSAALVLVRAGRTVSIVDAGAPRNAPAEHSHGFLTRDGMPPPDLLAAGRAEVAGYGASLVDDTVTGIEPGFVLTLASGEHLRARRLLLATGLRDELPDVPGVRERWGRDLLHCPYCHGYEVRDRPLGVLGGTPDAVQHALLVRQWSSDVTMFAHTSPITSVEREQLAARGIRVVDGVVARLVVADDRLRGVELEDGSMIPRAAVFVRPSFVPNSGLLTGLGCQLDENGWVTHDVSGRTSVDGVWVAGNAADPRAQLITAAGQGSAAAIAINAHLVDEDVARAVADSRAARHTTSASPLPTSSS